MTDTLMKDFPTDEVLSVVTGRLVSDVDGIYRVLNYVTGEELFTHQLPRVADEATPVILKCHPELQQACDEAKQVTPENYEQWRTTWLKRYGATISVPRLSHDEHERIDPISELAEKTSPNKLRIVKL